MLSLTCMPCVCHMHTVCHMSPTCSEQDHSYWQSPPCTMDAVLCRVRLDWKFATLCKPGETMGDMPFALYGPDMYQVCLHSMSAMGFTACVQVACSTSTMVGVSNSGFVSRQDAECVAASHGVHGTLLQYLRVRYLFIWYDLCGHGLTIGANVTKQFKLVKAPACFGCTSQCNFPLPQTTNETKETNEANSALGVIERKLMVVHKVP